jgi:lipopolysaccharide transport system ATP-binding protein
MSDVLVKVETVSKRFCRSLKRSLWYGLLDLGSELGGSRYGDCEGLPRSSADVELRKDEFWAVKDVSFELRRGECLGLIGMNGAGKTTLLRMLNGLIKPDTGLITTAGNVNAIIALGAGFNPILTGRENIYISAALMGIKGKKLASVISSIIDFSEIGEFIDTPVQSYSSGMQVRLAFASSVFLEPDVLILDEVLAVGDAGFRAKCYSQISKLISQAAVIFVSHSMDYVSSICTSVLCLQHGTGTTAADVRQGIKEYNESLKYVGFNDSETARRLDHPILTAEFKASKYQVSYGSELIFFLNTQSLEQIDDAILAITLRDEAGQLAATWRSDNDELPTKISMGLGIIEIKFGALFLASGNYKISCYLKQKNGIKHYIWLHNIIDISFVGPEFSATGVFYMLPGTARAITIGPSI